jgi:hypothetical protein
MLEGINTAENFLTAFASLDESQAQKLYKDLLKNMSRHAQR